MNTLIVYHRCGGKSLGYPPNTVLTAEWAAKNGAQAIEYDVAVAKDESGFKVFVVEPKLLKAAGLDINNLSWDDVRKIDTGNEKFGPQKIALLEEMLGAVNSERVAHQIQIKGQHPATVKEVLARVKGVKNYIITAFDVNVIKEIKQVNEKTPVGWLIKPKLEPGDEAGVDLTAKLLARADKLENYSDAELSQLIQMSKDSAVEILLLSAPRIKEKGVVEKVRASGLQIGAWGIATNLALAKQMIGFGLDRFTIDNPEELHV